MLNMQLNNSGTDMLIKFIVLIVYFAFMIGVGMYFYKRNTSHSDYILGGRQLNVWVAALSAQASDMSGWLLLGLPGLAYLIGGVSEAIWTAIGLAIGTYLNWLIVAKRLRKYTQVAGDSLTLPDFLTNRFKSENPTLRIVGALFILVFFTIYTASGFVSGAKLFNQVFNVPYFWAVVISLVVIVAYTFLGGFKAVCWTDLFQGLLMFFAIIIVPILAIISLGGVGPAFGSIGEFSLVPGNGPNSFTTLGIISAIAWGLGYFGQPHILVRFMAIRSSKEVRPARIIAMVWVIIALAAAVLVGIFGAPYLAKYGIVLTGADTEKVFMYTIDHMFGPVLAGIFLSAILAAIMSTADSQLLVTASAVSSDIYKVVTKKKASEKTLIWVSRAAVIVVAVIAGIIALDENSVIFSLVSYAWAGFGATFGPLVLFSLFWKRCNYAGAVAGVLTGGITAIVWKSLPAIVGFFTGASEVVLPTFFQIYEIIPGFVLSSLAIIVVSLLTKSPSKEIVDEFDSIKTAQI